MVDVFLWSIKINIDKIIEILKHRGMGSVRRSKAMFENAQIEAAQDKPSTPIQTRRMRLGLKIYDNKLYFKELSQFKYFRSVYHNFLLFKSGFKRSDILPDWSAIDHGRWRCESRCANSRKLQGQRIFKDYIWKFLYGKTLKWEVF